VRDKISSWVKFLSWTVQYIIHNAVHLESVIIQGS
jgi:hypothetical protein